MTTDEQDVAQVGKELLEASGTFAGYQIALAETDDDLVLPALVVTARHEEDTQIILNGVEVKRYSLTLEVRGIQRQDDASALDSALESIDETFHPSVPQVLPSGGKFQGIMIDVQTDSASTLTGDSRTRRRVYDLFAARREVSLT